MSLLTRRGLITGAAALAIGPKDVLARLPYGGGGSATVIPPTGDKLLDVANAMSSGTWNNLSTVAGIGANTTLSSVFYAGPLAATIRGSTGPTDIIDAWSGAVWDPTHKKWTFQGGGHLGYYGNEHYQFDTTTLQWARVTNPANQGTEPDNGTGKYADGSPGANHTYTTQCFDPNRGLIVKTCLPGCFDDSGSAVTCYTVDPTTFNPGSVISVNYIDNNTQASAGAGVNAFCLFDSVSGFTYYISPDNHFTLGKLNLSASPGSMWTAIGSTGAFDGSNGGADIGNAFSDGNRYVVGCCIPGSGQSVNAFQLSVGNRIRPTVTGDATLSTSDAPGFIFHPGSQKYYCWNGDGSGGASAAIWTLDATHAGTGGDPWVWAKVNPSGSNTVTPTTPNSTGTFRRWEWISYAGVFLLCNRTGDAVYAYKP